MMMIIIISIIVIITDIFCFICFLHLIRIYQFKILYMVSFFLYFCKIFIYYIILYPAAWGWYAPTIEARSFIMKLRLVLRILFCEYTRFIKRRSVTLVKGRRVVLIVYDKEKETPWVQTLVLLSDFTPFLVTVSR